MDSSSGLDFTLRPSLLQLLIALFFFSYTKVSKIRGKKSLETRLRLWKILFLDSSIGMHSGETDIFRYGNGVHI